MADFGLHRSRQAPAEETPSFGGIAERFRRAGDLDRAIALCQEGLKKFPNQLSARVTLGWAFLDRGEYDLARAELERVLRRAPDNLAAIRGMAELHDRAEHTAPSMAAVNHWRAPEEAAAEVPEPAPAAQVVQEHVPAAAPTFEVSASTVPLEEHLAPVPAPTVAPDEPRAPVLPVDPLPVVHLSEATVDATDALSLIETPAEAAVARSLHTAAPPSVSVFERVLDRRGEDAVVALNEPEAAPVDFDLVWTSNKADTPPPDLSGFDLNGWSDSPEAAAAHDSHNQSALLAQNAESDLAQTPSDSMTGSPDDDQPVVIDLLAIDVGLEGELLQFEQVAELDPDLPAVEEGIPAIAVEVPSQPLTLSEVEPVHASDIARIPESLGEAGDEVRDTEGVDEVVHVAGVLDVPGIVEVAEVDKVTDVEEVAEAVETSAVVEVAGVEEVAEVEEVAKTVEVVEVTDVEDVEELDEVDEEDETADDVGELEADEPAGAPAAG